MPSGSALSVGAGLTQKRPFSGTLTVPESGRSFTVVGDADHGRWSVARGDARLLGSAYGDGATHD
jgi:hypothetical protein